MSSSTSSETGGRWIPLESNPDVFNLWSKKAGVLANSAHFEDVYGLDEELLAMVPQPVRAVVLLFPIDSEGDKKRNVEDERIAREGQPKIDDTIFWVKQTIPNACGTIGLIHALANSGVTFAPTSVLQKFIFQCEGKTPLERAHLLETTPLFANIHAESASSEVNQTAAKVDTDLHFTCFVEAPDSDFRKAAKGEDVSEEAINDKKSTGMRLIELDGRRAGPVDHGDCKDLLKDVATLVKARYITSSSSVYFSLMALSETPEEK
ncbi:hypothetical protein GALMADRAFT_253635 [Galerina marginata CBS 339.88]|uniref:Ubiquitin carboxyl-terminal hydrolase n=1 Tax=Galerina marginata (strain CBS 339.88) TaxID=685588 RepID=A0A067SLS7_GALM3|nr:hypothetical protein GALMADRAFT_253635 [Galerina marginata CBS 339.88]